MTINMLWIKVVSGRWPPDGFRHAAVENRRFSGPLRFFYGYHERMTDARSSSRTARRLLTGLAAILIAGALGACSGRAPNAPEPAAGQPLDSPVHVLEALKYAYEHRDIELYRHLFTDDFVFLFAQTDSAGNAFRDRPWTRDDEIVFATHLFVGGGTEPPADTITLHFTNPLVDFPSTLHGANPAWHREIRAEVNLRVVRGETAIEVRGPGLFYFVRGDSAAIPADLYAEGARPDSTRWWIDRWEDETTSSAAPAAILNPNPLHTASWGNIKSMYR